MTERERKIKLQTIDEMYLLMRVTYATNEERDQLARLIEEEKKRREGNDRRKEKINASEN